MTKEDLKPIIVTFKTPTHGYWDGGKKSGGTFEPTLHNPDDPNRSYVEWGCWELNHYFRHVLHYEKGAHKGSPINKTIVMQNAKNYLRKTIRIPATIRELHT